MKSFYCLIMVIIARLSTYGGYNDLRVYPTVIQNIYTLVVGK